MLCGNRIWFQFPHKREMFFPLSCCHLWKLCFCLRKSRFHSEGRALYTLRPHITHPTDNFPTFIKLEFTTQQMLNNYWLCIHFLILCCSTFSWLPARFKKFEGFLKIVKTLIDQLEKLYKDFNNHQFSQNFHFHEPMSTIMIFMGGRGGETFKIPSPTYHFRTYTPFLSYFKRYSLMTPTIPLQTSLTGKFFLLAKTPALQLSLGRDHVDCFIQSRFDIAELYLLTGWEGRTKHLLIDCVVNA